MNDATRKELPKFYLEILILDEFAPILLRGEKTLYSIIIFFCFSLCEDIDFKQIYYCVVVLVAFF